MTIISKDKKIYLKAKDNRIQKALTFTRSIGEHPGEPWSANTLHNTIDPLTPFVP